MRDKINRIVKKREGFRPFAPSVKAEYANEFFELHEGCDYSTMLITARVKNKYRELLPAVVHIDGTARVQAVAKTSHPKYWSLIDRFESFSNFPIVLNTSFNIKGQAIVCYADQAVSTFLNTEIDILVINNYLMTKI